MTTGPATPPVPAAGWYADPWAPGTYRYWDGTHWTEHTAPIVVPTAPVAPKGPPAASPRTMSGGVTFVLIIVAVTLLVAVIAAAPGLLFVLLILVGAFVAAALLGLIVRLINWLQRDGAHTPDPRRNKDRPAGRFK